MFVPLGRNAVFQRPSASFFESGVFTAAPAGVWRSLWESRGLPWRVIREGYDTHPGLFALRPPSFPPTSPVSWAKPSGLHFPGPGLCLHCQPGGSGVGSGKGEPRVPPAPPGPVSAVALAPSVAPSSLVPLVSLTPGCCWHVAVLAGLCLRAPLCLLHFPGLIPGLTLPGLEQLRWSLFPWLDPVQTCSSPGLRPLPPPHSISVCTPLCPSTHRLPALPRQPQGLCRCRLRVWSLHRRPSPSVNPQLQCNLRGAPSSASPLPAVKGSPRSSQSSCLSPLGCSARTHRGIVTHVRFHSFTNFPPSVHFIHMYMNKAFAGVLFIDVSDQQPQRRAWTGAG